DRPPLPRNVRQGCLALSVVCALALSVSACGGGSSGGSAGSQFTSAGLAQVLSAVKADAGAKADLIEIEITSSGTDVQIRKATSGRGLHFDPGSNTGSPFSVQLVGSGSLSQTVFPLSDVQAAAVDKIIKAAPAVLGVKDFTPNVMTL